MAEARKRGLGQLEAVALIVAPAAQVHRLVLARLDLHPEQLDEEAQALVRERREQLRVADVGEVVDRFGTTSFMASLARLLEPRAQAVELVRQRARLELGRA